MSLLPDAKFDEVYAADESMIVIVRRDQITGSISFEAGDGVKRLDVQTRKSLHDRLDAFLNDEITK